MSIKKKIKSYLLNKFYRNISPEHLKKIHVKHHLPGIHLWSEREFVFIHVPKAAGTSINFSLDMPDIGHLTFSELNLRDSFSFNSDKIYFCVLRDPIQRIASTFRYAYSQLKRNGGWTGLVNITDYINLSSFVEKGLNEDLVKNHYFFQPTSKFIENSPPNNTYIIDFDKINEGVKRLSEVIGENIDLPVMNSSSSFTASVLDIDLGPMHIDKIRKLYKKDYELCEYIKNKNGLLLLRDFYRDEKGC